MPGDYPQGETGPSRGYGGGPPRGRGPRGPGEGGYRERRGVPLSDLDPTLTAISRNVIGCAIDVHKALGPGYPDAVYLAALRKEMETKGISYKAGQTVPVKYHEATVGEVTAELLIEGRFIVDVMARPGDVGTYERLAVKAAGLDLGLIINFSERRLKDGLVRVLNIDKINADRGVDFGEDEGGHADAPDGGSTVSFS